MPDLSVGTERWAGSNAGNGCWADLVGKWAELAIRIDPLREKSHFLAIEALAQSGDWAAAIAKFAGPKRR